MDLMDDMRASIIRHCKMLEKDVGKILDRNYEYMQALNCTVDNFSDPNNFWFNMKASLACIMMGIVPMYWAFYLFIIPFFYKSSVVHVPGMLFYAIGRYVETGDFLFAAFTFICAFWCHHLLSQKQISWYQYIRNLWLVIYFASHTIGYQKYISFMSWYFITVFFIDFLHLYSFMRSRVVKA